MLLYCKVMKLADMPSGLGGGEKRNKLLHLILLSQ
jgi:hypothetical protein